MKTKILVIAIAATLGGCGGGSSSDTAATQTTPTAQAAAAVTLSGTAATGGPFGGATVSVIDKSGTVIGSSTTSANGAYGVTLPAGATGPFVIQAVRDDMTLTSFAADTSATTLNITPITTLIASRLSVSGDPGKLAAEMKADPTLLASDKVSLKIAEVVALLKPLLDAIGTAVNPLTGSFTADGTGIDRVLDSLSVKITPAGTAGVNIEVAVKQSAADGEQPVTLTFTNKTVTIGQLPTVVASKLVPTGTAPLIADLLTRVTACYALPVADRVNVPDPKTAVPSDVKASACKSIFEGNDPATYKSNGSVVGRGSNTTFGTIFGTGANNLVFDRGSYLFTRANGDLVIGYRTVDGNGGITNGDFVARVSATDTKLHLIGNQYAYSGGVVPYQQLREFVNQPAASYYSTGYDLRVAKTDALGKVIVTDPKGAQTTLVNGEGSANMVVRLPGAPASGTSYVRYRSEFVDPATTSDPASTDTSLVFSSPRLADAEVVSIPHQSMWKFDYYLTTNQTTTPDATQYYKTVGRALSIGELKNQPLANLADVDIADLKAGTDPKLGTIAVGGNASLDFDWTVGPGALAPTAIKAFGTHVDSSTVKTRFDDGMNVSSVARSAKILCSTQSISDLHCADVNGVIKYATSNYINGVHLLANDASLHEFAHFYALYKVTIK